jgi:hypothetical protein
MGMSGTGSVSAANFSPSIALTLASVSPLTTKTSQPCALAHDGAQRASSRSSRMTPSGTSSGRKARMLLRSRMASDTSMCDSFS